MTTELKNKNHWWKIFLSLWAVVFLYLIIMNSGVFPLTINYEVDEEHPFISKLWPRSGYEIQENIITVNNSIYLDLDLNTNFEELYVYVDGLAFSDTDLKLVLKDNFEGGPIVVEDLQMGDWTYLDMSDLGRRALLVLSLDEGDSYQINNLILKFKEPAWFNWFK